MRLFALVVLCACGRIAFDARDDGGPGDVAAPGPISISTFHVYPQGAEPFAGATLVISDASGAMQQMLTSSGGEDTVVIEPGSTVTALFSNPTFRGQAQVIIGVQPGDRLQFGTREVRPTQLLGTMNLNITPPVNGPGVTVSTPCTFMSGMPTSIERRDFCPQTTFDLLVTSYGATPVYSIVPVSWQDGGTITVDTYVAAQQLTVNLSGIPTGVTRASLSTTARRDDTYAELPGGAQMDSPGSTLSAMFPAQLTVGDMRLVSYSLSTASQPELEAGQGRTFRRAVNETSFDLVVDPMPRVVDFAIDFANPAMTLVTDDAGRSTTTVFAVHTTREGRTDRTVDWMIVAPAGVTRVPFAELPAQFADWLPKLDDLALDMTVDIYDLDVWAEYRVARETPSWRQWPTVAQGIIWHGAQSTGVSGAYRYYQ